MKKCSEHYNPTVTMQNCHNNSFNVCGETGCGNKLTRLEKFLTHHGQTCSLYCQTGSDAFWGKKKDQVSSNQQIEN